MRSSFLRFVVLALLALVFTIGLTFATIELPHRLDDLLQKYVVTPGGDSHADDLALLRAELFISHYHLRFIGYACFGLTVLLIILGFATRASGLAVLGAVGFMLPVFAQFAGVMFFLAGLGLLNLPWLPILDISLEVSRLGLIVRAPFDFLMWALRTVGVNGYWPLIYAFIGGGLLLFFLGTLAWLSSRIRGESVAVSPVYRISRHPQYLGWILWSYGVYLLLMVVRYPKRSWGIDASLPWLLSTLVIIGVAMLEEINMRQRFGAAYDEYRGRVPFLFPLPRFIGWLFALPTRLLFHRPYPERKREAASVLLIYTMLLLTASALFYAGGWEWTRARFTSPAEQVKQIQSLVYRLRIQAGTRPAYFVGLRLAAIGGPAADYVLPLLDDPRVDARIAAAEFFKRVPAVGAAPALIEMLSEREPRARGQALHALARIGLPESREAMMGLLDDSVRWVRCVAATELAGLGAREIMPRLILGLRDPDPWVRIAYLNALGTLGAEEAVPEITQRLEDPEAEVRRIAVLTLLRIGSPDAKDALAQAATDEDWEVRVYAAESRKRL